MAKWKTRLPCRGQELRAALEEGARIRTAFYAYSSFNYPSTIFRYDIATGKSPIFRESAIKGFQAEDYETAQVFYTSKDGTRVPMFLVFKRGLKLDGSNPTLLYAYGGFNVSIPPEFNPLRLALLEQGVIYASANIRGGGEYGEKWHQAGMKLQKQNVFDDFIAAAEWLIANNTPRRPNWRSPEDRTAACWWERS